MKLPTLTTSLLIAGLTFGSTALMAADYVIDTKDAHASIKFRVQHLAGSMVALTNSMVSSVTTKPLRKKQRLK